MNNCITSTKKILSILGVCHTSKYINDNILSHQDHNSLLAIADTLSKYNVINVALQLTTDKFNHLQFPCVAQVSTRKTDLFYVIESINATTVSFYDDKGKLQHDTVSNFQKIWTGICLLVEKTENSKEVDIERKLVSKKFQTLLLSLAILSLITWLILNFLKVEFQSDFFSMLHTFTYTIVKLIGLVVGVLLLWFEIDQYNPTLQNFCSGSSKKINCNAVLKSKYATLFRGSLNLSLSSIGFSYFFATSLFLFISGFSVPSLSLLAILSIIITPVVFVSFYYQALVIKQWCKFCIILQLVLLTETLIAFLSGFYKGSLYFQEIPLLVALFILPILGWGKLKPLLENEKVINFYRRRLKKVKNNIVVFNTLLEKSRKITTNSEGLGIVLSGENAKYDIIKVCNPYCTPCAMAHPILESLVNDDKINLQILFLSDENDNGFITKPVKHFLAIDDQKGPSKTQQALHDWYDAKQKDYGVFASKYPMNKELNKQNEKIKSMRVWCETERIKHTPTIFINGHELPSEYDIEDLIDVL